MSYDPMFLGEYLALPAVPLIVAANVTLPRGGPSRDADPAVDAALRAYEDLVAMVTGAVSATTFHGRRQTADHAMYWSIVVVNTPALGMAAFGCVLHQRSSGWSTQLASVAQIEASLGGLVELDDLKLLDATSSDEAARMRHALRGGTPHVPEALFRELVDRSDAILGAGDGDDGGLESLEPTAPPEVTIPVLLEVVVPGWQPPPGVEVLSRLGGIASAQATRAGLEALQADPHLLRVEASRDGGVQDCVTSVPFAMGDAARFPGWPGEDGSGCLIAIIDGGIDVLHECFRDADGNARIIAVWNQLDPAGPSPHEVDPTFFPTYGTYYPESKIAEFVAEGKVPALLGRDHDGHGTHVASIAAGRATAGVDGAPGFAGGMAPGAKVVVVIPKLVTDVGDTRSIGYSTAHADALFGLIRPLALARGCPVVVNVSLGMNAGAHDGKTLLEGAFDRFTNGGRDPGFAIVKSAGNEFGHSGHASVVPFAGVQEIEWEARAGARSRDYFEGWYDGSLDLEFTLIDPAGRRSPPVSVGNPIVAGELGNNSFTLQLTPFHPDNGDHQLIVEISGAMVMIQPGTWKLEIVGRSASGDHQFHIWVERDDRRLVSFSGRAGEANEFTLSIPGTARTVITTGAIGAALPVRLMSSSSFGPTRDLRKKPDVCAPGSQVVAARGGTRTVMAMTGTSQSAPHVTGAIALLFSRQVRLGRRRSNAAQIQAALTHTTRGFANQWHPGFGYGPMDALAFIHALVPGDPSVGALAQP